MKPFHFYTSAATFHRPPNQAAPSKPRHASPDIIRSADMLALVMFGGKARVLNSFCSAYDGNLIKVVEKLTSVVGSEGSSTNLAAGIRLANDLLANAPRGLLRRAWVLSDGVDNEETDMLFAEVARSRALRINLNTIAFGAPGSFDESRLRQVAKGTHNGRYIPVATAKALGAAFSGKDRGPGAPASHRGEATVFVIDASGSMVESMEGSTKIAIVRDTLARLVRYKQRMWS